MTNLVVLDWSAARLDATLVGTDGKISATHSTEDGLSRLARGEHAAALGAALSSWRAEGGPLDIVAAGMVGSRSGWIEMPYVPVPARLADVARAIRREHLGDWGTIFFVPGLTEPSARPYPDVMRGEEMTLLGVGLDAPATVILPGTHSKWARVGGGRIETFRTFVTGEVRDLFLRHSTVAKILRQPSSPRWDAFAAGLALALGDEPRGGLLTQLFSARTGWLAERIAPDEIGDYVLGLTIGAEFHAARDAGWLVAGDTVVIAGDTELEEPYRRAAVVSGIYPILAPADVAVRGALALNPVGLEKENSRT